MKLFHNFNKFKNSKALVDKNNEIDFQEIYKESLVLKKIIKKNNIILIVAENSIGSILSYIYSILNGYVVIFIDSAVNKNEIENIIKTYKPNFVACENDIFQSFKITKLKSIYKVYQNVFFYQTKFKKINNNDNLQMLLPTSGSLGSNKYVKISKENIYENTKSIIKYLKITKKDRAITNMPFCYSYMLSIINTHLQTGGCIFVSKLSMIQKEFWNYFNEFKITSFNGVPYIYEILDKIGLKRMFSKNLRYITQAGGKLDNELSLKIAKLSLKKKIKFFTMYGQTEASPRISFLNPEFAISKNGSIGKAIPNTKIWLQNNNKKISKPFKKGNIFCSGKNIMMGYAKSNEDLLKSNKLKKFLDTGDIGYFDNQGFFFITGRSKRHAKIYGNRVDLDELETKMKSKKLEIVCIGKLNLINVFYKNKKNLEKIKKELYKILNQNLSDFRFFFVKNFPRTSTKKINYNLLSNFDDKL